MYIQSNLHAGYQPRWCAAVGTLLPGSTHSRKYRLDHPFRTLISHDWCRDNGKGNAAGSLPSIPASSSENSCHPPTGRGRTRGRRCHAFPWDGGLAVSSAQCHDRVDNLPCFLGLCGSSSGPAMKSEAVNDRCDVAPRSHCPSAHSVLLQCDCKKPAARDWAARWAARAFACVCGTLTALDNCFDLSLDCACTC